MSETVNIATLRPQYSDVRGRERVVLPQRYFFLRFSSRSQTAITLYWLGMTE